MANEEVSEIATLLSEFNTKIADIEARHELLRERVLNLGNTFIKSRDDIRREFSLIKGDISAVKESIEKIQENLRHILLELENFARKEELQIFEKYIKLWQPLKFVKAEEVREIIEEYLKKLKIGMKPEEEQNKEQ